MTPINSSSLSIGTVSLRAHAGELNDRRLHRIVHIARHRLHVGDLNHLLGFQYAAKAGSAAGRINGARHLASVYSAVAPCKATVRNAISFAEKHDAELCAAQM